MLEAETQRLATERTNVFRQQGVTVERYLELTNRTMEQWQEEVAEAATQQLQGRLVLEAVAERERIRPTTQQIATAIEAEVEQAMATDQRTGRQVRSFLSTADGRSRIRTGLQRQHALDWLVRNARGDIPETANEAETTDDEPADESNA